MPNVHNHSVGKQLTEIDPQASTTFCPGLNCILFNQDKIYRRLIKLHFRTTTNKFPMKSATIPIKE